MSLGVSNPPGSHELPKLQGKCSVNLRTWCSNNPSTFATSAKAPAEKIVPVNGNDHLSMAGIQRSIDQRQVAVVDARFAHARPCNAHQKSRLRVADQDLVEVQSRDAAFAGGRAEADGDARARRGG